MKFLPPKWPVEPPLTRARASLWDRCIAALPMWQTRPRNVVAGAFTTTHGSPALVATPRGYGLDFNGNDQALSFPATFTGRKISVSFMFRRTVANTAPKVLIESTTNYNTTQSTFGIFLATGNKIQLSIHDVSSLYKVVEFALPPAGEMAFFTATFDYRLGQNSSLRLWQNGLELTGTVTINASFTAVTPFATAPIYIAARAANSFETQTQFSSFLLHDRLLSDEEIRLLHADPFQMFAPAEGAIAALSGGAASGGIVTDLDVALGGIGGMDAAPISTTVSGATLGGDGGVFVEPIGVTAAEVSLGGDGGVSVEPASVTSLVVEVGGTAGISSDQVVVTTISASFYGSSGISANTINVTILNVSAGGESGLTSIIQAGQQTQISVALGGESGFTVTTISITVLDKASGSVSGLSADPIQISVIESSAGGISNSEITTTKVKVLSISLGGVSSSENSPRKISILSMSLGGESRMSFAAIVDTSIAHFYDNAKWIELSANTKWSEEYKATAIWRQ